MRLEIGHTQVSLSDACVTSLNLGYFTSILRPHAPWIPNSSCSVEFYTLHPVLYSGICAATAQLVGFFVLQRKFYTASSDIFGHLRGDGAIGVFFRLAA